MGSQRKEYNAEKYIQMLSLTIRVYLHSFSSCCLPNVKSREIPREFELTAGSGSSKVIDLGVNRKRICDFLLVINSNLDLSLTFFRDIDIKAKNGLFSPPLPCLTPPG